VADAVATRRRGGRNREERLRHLIDSARVVFARQGFRRTQMAHVAEAAGVSTGNLYNYVETKEALFDLVLRQTLGLPGERLPEQLPIPHRTIPQTVSWLRRRLNFRNDFPLLEAAATEPHGKLEPVGAELFDVAFGLAPGFAVMERSAPDLPELLSLFLSLRRGLIERLTAFIQSGAEAGELRQVESPEVTARLILEAALWASQRRIRDRESAAVSDDAARESFIDLVTATLAPSGPSAARR
jgi:AcrR family transcriptional regulator